MLWMLLLVIVNQICHWNEEIDEVVLCNYNCTGFRINQVFFFQLLKYQVKQMEKIQSS